MYQKEKKSRYFPCWACRGEGRRKEPILDDGSGPIETCGYCDGEGMIEIGGSLHKKIKKEFVALKALEKFGEKEDGYSYQEILKLGEDIEKLVKNIRK